RLAAGGLGQAEVSAQIEEVVLDARERRLDCGKHEVGRTVGMKTNKTNHAIGLVHLAHGGDARVVLRPSRAVAEAGLAAVAGARVDNVQSNHGVPPDECAQVNRFAAKAARVSRLPRLWSQSRFISRSR